jgi:MORN repeat variant
MQRVTRGMKLGGRSIILLGLMMAIVGMWCSNPGMAQSGKNPAICSSTKTGWIGPFYFDKSGARVGRLRDASICRFTSRITESGSFDQWQDTIFRAGGFQNLAQVFFDGSVYDIYEYSKIDEYFVTGQLAGRGIHKSTPYYESVATNKNGNIPCLDCRYLRPIGPVINFYPNGRPKSTMTFDINWQIQGEWREFYPNGQMKYQATYVDGRLIGEPTEYNENGTVKR